MHKRKIIASSPCHRGEAITTNPTMTCNDLLQLKVLGAPKPLLCERCHVRKAEMLVVGEREGMAVYICRRCREPSRFPMILSEKKSVR